jgi:hypothetical protein
LRIRTNLTTFFAALNLKHLLQAPAKLLTKILLKKGILEFSQLHFKKKSPFSQMISAGELISNLI